METNNQRLWSQAIIPYSYLSNQGLVHGLNGGDSFFNKWERPFVKGPFVERVLALPG